MSILKMLQEQPNVSLEFVNLTKDLDGQGNMIIILTLKEALAKVIGRRIDNPLSGDSVNIEANDVTEIRIHQRTVEELDTAVNEGKAKFEWDKAAKKGIVTCDFRLDVSQNEQVWLTKESFANFARNQRNQRRANRTATLSTKIRSGITKAELAEGVKEQPEVVATN